MGTSESFLITRDTIHVPTNFTRSGLYPCHRYVNNHRTRRHVMLRFTQILLLLLSFGSLTPEVSFHQLVLTLFKGPFGVFQADLSLVLAPRRRSPTGSTIPLQDGFKARLPSWTSCGDLLRTRGRRWHLSIFLRTLSVLCI